MMRSSVDFPPPLGPRSAVSEPVGTSSDTSSSATASPKRFEMDSTSMLTPCLPVPGVAVAVGQRQEAQDDERGQTETTAPT